MKSQWLHRSLAGYIAFLLILLAAGCSGSGADGGPTNPNNNPILDNAPTSLQVTADTGDFIAVRVNESVVLDGSRSSTSSAFALLYTWSFTSIPAGSTAVLQNPTSSTPGFTPDVAGTYMVQLVVSAGGVESQRAIAAVEVSSGGQYTGWHVHSNYKTFHCANCHDGQVTRAGKNAPIQRKSGNHLATSNVCEACHTTFGFNLIRYVDHLEVFGSCSSCHNGVAAIGKSEFHVVTTAECDDCHTTSSFFELQLDGSFDHTGITSGCSRCHNGVTAIGKTPTTLHDSTTSDCSACHTVGTFIGGFPDHTGPSVVGHECRECHNNTNGSAAGEPLGHPVMNVDCAQCHGISGFRMLDNLYNHRVDPTLQRCDTCHTPGNSFNALTKADDPNGHPVTTEDCGVCHNAPSIPRDPAYPGFAAATFDHTGINSNCASCHGDTPTATPVGPQKHANHMPTTEDCSTCHTPGTFITGTYDHLTGNTSTCTLCHNDTITAGKHATHIPTTQDCDACHLNTTTFTGAAFNHTGITNNCVSCHDGNISTGKTGTHLPTSQDCVLCHSTSGPFKPANNFAHTGITNNCESCHDGRLNNTAAGAIGKTANHIPAQQVCSQCHTNTNTGGFADPSRFLSNVHPGQQTGCEGCHTTQFITANPNAVKSAGHLPTQQDCDVCHNSNTSFATINFTHAGITTNCESCHDGNYVAPAGALGKANDPTPPHPTTTQECSACHAIGNNFQDGTFDHTGIVNNCAACHGDTTTNTPVGPKKNPGHVQTTQDCSVCHVPGTFKNAVFNHTGITNNCASCHAGTAPVGTVKSGNHIPTTEDCSVCHNTTVFAGARFDHTGVVNNCAVCHNGNTAMGKDGSHVPTNQDCSVCHLTTGFIPGTFDHVGIVDNCQSCHNGILAKGKNNGHVQTNQDCGVCHNTLGFIPATFDHSTVTNATRCDSCHGVTATGKDAKTNPAHLATSLDCRSCHTTATFIGGTWVHDSTTAGNCDTCHSPGNGATPKSNGHLNTNEQCDVCHSTNGWAPTSFTHSNGGNYPGKHRRDPGCSGCHTVSIGAGLTNGNYPNKLQYAPFCAGCHTGKFKRKGDHIGGENGTVEQNKDCSGGGKGCHKVGDSGF